MTGDDRGQHNHSECVRSIQTKTCILHLNSRPVIERHATYRRRPNTQRNGLRNDLVKFHTTVMNPFTTDILNTCQLLSKHTGIPPHDSLYLLCNHTTELDPQKFKEFVLLIQSCFSNSESSDHCPQSSQSHPTAYTCPIIVPQMCVNPHEQDAFNLTMPDKHYTSSYTLPVCDDMQIQDDSSTLPVCDDDMQIQENISRLPVCDNVQARDKDGFCYPVYYDVKVQGDEMSTLPVCNLSENFDIECAYTEIKEAYDDLISQCGPC